MSTFVKDFPFPALETSLEDTPASVARTSIRFTSRNNNTNLERARLAAPPCGLAGLLGALDNGVEGAVGKCVARRNSKRVPRWSVDIGILVVRVGVSRFGRIDDATQLDFAIDHLDGAMLVVVDRGLGRRQCAEERRKDGSLGGGARTFARAAAGRRTGGTLSVGRLGGRLQKPEG